MATANKYGYTQQLRSHIHDDVLRLIDEVEKQARQEQKDKDARKLMDFLAREDAESYPIFKVLTDLAKAIQGSE